MNTTTKPKSKSIKPLKKPKLIKSGRYGNFIKAQTTLIKVAKNTTLIGWKKCYAEPYQVGPAYIVKLQITPRSLAVICGSIEILPTQGVILRNKCRANSALVLDIYELHNTTNTVNLNHPLPGGTVAYSIRDANFTYVIGKRVRAKYGKFDPNSLDNCGIGIHFFLNINDAIAY